LFDDGGFHGSGDHLIPYEVGVASVTRPAMGWSTDTCE
jgi:hypothetical protein